MPLPLDFRVAYTSLGRIAGENLNQSDLLMIPADGSSARSLTDFIRADDEVAYTCHHSCIIDDGVTWLAVATGPPDADGFFSFKMGRFNADQLVNIDKSAPLEGVVDLHFGHDYVYYTRLHRTQGAYRQYAVLRASLARPGQPEQVALFPPDEVLEHSTYSGRFSINPATEDLVFLNPTVRSQSVYVWRDGALDQIDYICPSLRNGECVGAGSEYADNDPVAISRDGRYVALFVVAGRDLRIRLYDLNAVDLGGKPYLTLAQAPLGEAYYTAICSSKEPWQFAEITGKPVFSPDGAHLYFIGLNDPTRAGCDQEKPETDLLRLEVSRVFEPRPIEESDLVNLTRLPRNGSAEQVVIDAFALSPDGEVLVYSGTPQFQESGDVITSGSSRHKNDRELWVIGADGRAPTQITNDKRWRAMSPTALP